MNRRESLVSLAAAAFGITLTPELVEALQARPNLSDAEIQAWLRAVGRVEPQPGEAQAIRTFLNELTSAERTDPRVQPAFGFDPEVEP